MKDQPEGRDIKRRYIRARPDPLDHAEIQFGVSPEFKPDAVGLIVDEAPMGGASVVILSTSKVHEGLECRVKVGRLQPLRAQVRWIRELDKEILRVGLRFLE
jgi:hypothetical protein